MKFAVRWNSLSVKLMVTVGIGSLLTIGIFSWVSITAQRNQLMSEVIRNASLFSDTVKRSTRHAMLENRLEMAYEIMETIGRQEGVDKVRVFNKEGVILFSTYRPEAGVILDKRGESCYACHEAEKPLKRLNVPQRARIFRSENNGRILGMITPIYNEPSCVRGGCHPANKSVLGVLDVDLSLAPVDNEIASITRKMALFSGGTLLLILSTIAVFLRKWVLRPVRDLLQGTERVAEGDLAHEIPARSEDEIGRLASSFNAMTRAVQQARGELDALVETLEEQVEERTKDLQETQAQLVQSEKLASLGKLAASIAHEINNPLAGILTYAKLLTKRLGKGVPDEEGMSHVLKSLSLIERETNRCTTIVRNMLDFARQRRPSFQEVQVNAVLDETLSLLWNQMNIQGVGVEKHLGDLPLVWADPGQLRQVFMNVAMNACEAMSAVANGASLTIDSRFLPDESVVEVGFADTGPGIPSEVKSKIFDPFFTTKDKGTGLGLSVVYGIVNRHGGKIEIDSEEGKGTSITIRLPVGKVPEQDVSQ